METLPCPVTGSREGTPFLCAPDRFNPQGPTWQLVRSSASGLVMLDPRPAQDDMATHYPAEAYDPFLHSGNSRSLRDRLYLALSSLLLRGKAGIVMKGIRKPPESVHILETGCSSGRLLIELHRSYGVPLQNLWGVEPDRRSADAARAAGLTRITGTYLVDSVFDHQFDRIVFWHALEHLHRINETLETTHRLLNPDGVMVIALPNLQSFDARHYGKHWIALDAPRHLWHFTPDTLGKLLEKHGFTVLDLGRWLPDTLYNLWYSEKLTRTIDGRRFGIGGFMQAATGALRSLASGIDPCHASGIVVRAVVKKGY